MSAPKPCATSGVFFSQLSFRQLSGLLLVVLASTHSNAVPSSIVKIAGAPALLVNQIGYTTAAPKRALLRNSSPQAQTLDIVAFDSQQVVGQARIGPVVDDPHSLDHLSEVRFDDLNTQGRYQLRLGTLTSSVFSVSPHPNDALMRLLLRSYYLQRCGVALHDAESNLSHAVDHTEDGVLRHNSAQDSANQRVIATGGWHDAGDYGKYVAPTSVAVAQLLDVYTLDPSRYPDGQLNIPESNNGKSDLLDEINVGLRWLMHMQRADGAVWRKLSGTTWPKQLTPDQDTQTRYIYGISSPETAKFAAVTAQAARVFRDIDPAWSAQLQAAAERSWAWLGTQTQPQYIDVQAGDDSGSGGYLYSKTDQELSLLTDRDDRVWAAAELWLLTRKPEYLAVIDRERLLWSQLTLFEWKNTMLLGVVHLLRDATTNATTNTTSGTTSGTTTNDSIPNDLKQDLQAAVLRAADLAVQRRQHSGYALANHRFVWGSNKMVAGEGYLLAAAYQLTAKSIYREAAQAQKDFLLGLNPQGISFVTGMGQQRVRHVAHLYARASQQDIAGLLVGGANSSAQDQIAPKQQAIYSYIDHDQAYSVNEYAIDYNSAFIGLIGLLDATAGIEPVHP